jgi:hypothetical protein
MQQFILEQNISNFVHRLREVDSVAKRDVLCQLVIAEIDRHDPRRQREILEDWIVKVEQNMGTPCQDGAAVSIAQANLWQLLQQFKEHQRQLTARTRAH